MTRECRGVLSVRQRGAKRKIPRVGYVAQGVGRADERNATMLCGLRSAFRGRGRKLSEHGERPLVVA